MPEVDRIIIERDKENKPELEEGNILDEKETLISENDIINEPVAI